MLQVKNAEDAGAIAAIVYDDKYEALIIMSKHVDHPQPGITAVFINQNSGLILKQLLTPGVSVVTITPVGTPSIAESCMCKPVDACHVAI